MNRENWSPVWGAVIFLVGWNLCRHKRGKSTLCCSREDVPPGLMTAAAIAFVGWFAPHYELKRKRFSCRH